MDISDTLAPDSTQLDAVDLLGGPRIFTVKSVSRLGGDQPVAIELVEFDRPWKPGKSMRRVIAAAWGTDASIYPGRRVELYCNPDVSFGKDKVGGTRIKRISHIDKPLSVPLLVSRGKSAVYKVDPLPDDAPTSAPAPTEPTVEQVAKCADPDTLRDMWNASGPERRAQIEARVREITEEPQS